MPVEKMADCLATDLARGLAEPEATARREREGANVLRAEGRTPWYVVLGRQFTDVLILILVVAAGVSLAVGQVDDALTILTIVVLNGVLGFVQEWKAEQALAALQRMLAPKCRVVRGGEEREIDAAELVSGDIVHLEIGDRVPADLRLVESLNLRADESALTGEAASVAKDPAPVAEAAPLGVRSPMAWMGTSITNGRARGVVVATGMHTEFGRIAHLTESVGRERTVLQRRLAGLGRQLGIFSIGIAVAVTLLGVLLGRDLLEMFLTGVSLAVAVVPEGLPAVVTITLALGVRAMVRRRALLRRLQGAETLGEATVICTDKTGTLTENAMTVQRVWLAAGAVDVTGLGYDPAGHFAVDGARIDYHTRPDLLALLRTGLVCSHAHIERGADGWHEIGEPTEAALVVAAYKAWLSPGHPPDALSEFSFNSMRKRMTVIEHRPDGMLAHTKGAPEIVIARCTRMLEGTEERPLTGADRTGLDEVCADLAASGLRTLALARRALPADTVLNEDAVECDLTLLGVVGIIDPPRAEVPAAIRTATRAGIRTIMITGDAGATALAIARRIGLEADRAVTGTDLDAMEDGGLRQVLRGSVLFARTSPAHKLRVVSVLQGDGEVVAMTGDGVNDAPALKRADIGIAMGLRGTDVAKGAADMVLIDDNFASIIGAVEEGRRQYDNIQKFVRYLLSSNTGEVIAIFVNIVMGGPLILVPVQILWMNLVTDGMTAVALGVEPVEPGIMDRPPRAAAAPVLNRAGMMTILALGGYIGVGALSIFHHALVRGGPDGVAWAQTMTFTGIIVLEKFNVFNFRALARPLAVIGFLTNPWVIGAWAATVGLQVAAVYVPFLQRLLHTVPLDAADWLLLVGVAMPIVLMAEAWKWLRWRRSTVRGGGSGP